MSNISTAFGKIKLMSGSVKSLATLLTLQACNNSKEMDYPTCLYFGNECIDIHGVKGSNDNEKAFFLYETLLDRIKETNLSINIK